MSQGKNLPKRVVESKIQQPDTPHGWNTSHPSKQEKKSIILARLATSSNPKRPLSKNKTKRKTKLKRNEVARKKVK